MITMRTTTALTYIAGSVRSVPNAPVARLDRRMNAGRLSCHIVPLYAAYGSNMHPEQMLQRAPHSPMAGTGWLHGWRLTFGGEDLGWEGALATVVEDPLAKVFVVLYDMTKDDEKNLDRWEGSELGIHKKIRCRVDRVSSDTSIDPVLAWLYVLDGWEGGIPSARYLGVMAEAAEIAGAPTDYVHDLRTRPSSNIGPGT
jgi:AIG2 family protein